VQDAFGNHDDASVQITVRPRLGLAKSGPGTGVVTSDPPGIECGSDCTEASMVVDAGTTVRFTATPDPDSRFVGWSGACTGTGTCSVTLAETASVTATFAIRVHTLEARTTGTGSGNVTSTPAGINLAAGNATADFTHGTSVTLTAHPDPNSRFTGWSGACTGTSTCTLTLDAAATVTATFAIRVHTLEARTTGTGSGNVTSTPAGINLAAGNATADFTHGTSVTLTAHPDPNSRFTGWSGACTGTSTCTLTLDAAATVTATFAIRVHTLEARTTGTGSGNVTSTPAGINLAAGNATADFTHGTSVTLTAHPDPNSRFTGWSGACTGTSTCTLTSTQPLPSPPPSPSASTRSRRARPAPAAATSPAARPASTPPPARAPPTSSTGTSVTLTAHPDPNSRFTGWSGACTGTSTCTLTLDAAATVTARFEVVRYTLTVTATGNGNVTSSPAGIDVRAGNTGAEFVHGTTVTLRAEADSGSHFSRWSLASCPATDTCTVTLFGDLTVGRRVPARPLLDSSALSQDRQPPVSVASRWSRRARGPGGPCGPSGPAGPAGPLGPVGPSGPLGP
jgi:hypothetical protein